MASADPLHAPPSPTRGSPRRRRHGWAPLALGVLALGAGCAAGEADDDTTPPEPPAGCDGQSLQNIAFRFEYLYLGEPYGVDDFVDVLEMYGLEAGEFVYPGTVSAQEDVGGEHLVQVVLAADEDSGEPIVWVDNWYTLPSGLQIPVEVGQAVEWRMMVNHRGGVLRLAAQFADADGCMLFYAEPGRRFGFTGPGLAYDGLDELSASRVFSSVSARDYDCPLNVPTACGDQYNLALAFQVTGGPALEAFPGETVRFSYSEVTPADFQCSAEYDVTDVWSYDWRDVDPSCPDPDGIYERDLAFYVLRAGG
ncbi:hypothetical protein L6R50_04440 [Myxococcota bacterium]|nr:hypothetical protein [Myxococcota bacterium]